MQRQEREKDDVVRGVVVEQKRAPAAMSFGVANHGPVHSWRHPLAAKVDREMESARPPVPNVPRTVRAKPKKNPHGTFLHEHVRAAREEEYSRSWSLTPTRSSEHRRPNPDSPFAFARRHALEREKALPEFQQLEMGPARSIETRKQFDRGHVLGNAERSSSLPPGVLPANLTDKARYAFARRRTLQREQDAANQEYDWCTDIPADMPPPDFRRRKLISAKPPLDLPREHGSESFLSVLGPESPSL